MGTCISQNRSSPVDKNNNINHTSEKPLSINTKCDPINKNIVHQIEKNTLRNVVIEEKMIRNVIEESYKNTERKPICRKEKIYDFDKDCEMFVQLLNILHIDDILNCFLVKNNLRPAYMIQELDSHRKNRNTQKDIECIKSIFGFFTKIIDQGTIVSKTEVTDKVFENNAYTESQLGQLIGYPCYEDFKYYVNKNIFSSDERMVHGRIIIDANPNENENKSSVVLIENVMLEVNINKFSEKAEHIANYIDQLNQNIQEIQNTYGLSKCKLICRIEIEQIYNINECLGRFVLFEHYGTKMFKNKAIKLLIKNMLNIFIDCGYGLISILHNSKKINVLSPSLYCPIYSILNRIIEGEQELNKLMIEHICDELANSKTTEQHRIERSKELKKILESELMEVEKNTRIVLKLISEAKPRLIIDENDIDELNSMYCTNYTIHELAFNL